MPVSVGPSCRWSMTSGSMREGIRALLERHGDVCIVGEAGDGAEAERLASELQPREVLMDLRMPRTDGVTATQPIKRRWPDIQVLVPTTFDGQTCVSLD